MHPNRNRGRLQLCVMLAVAFLPGLLQAQFSFSTNNGALTITGYTGSGGPVTIPDTTNGYPVVRIGNSAFLNKSGVTSVTIPNSLTNIGINAFQNCSGLTNLSIPGSVTSIGASAFRGCTAMTSVTFYNGVTSIGNDAFNTCSALTSVVIPSSVTNTGTGAFGNCLFLSTAYFQGNAPKVNVLAGSTDNTVFYGGLGYFQESGVVYYPPGATGWGATFGSWPTVCTGSNTPPSAFSFVTNNGAITITGYIATNRDVVMPDSINGYPITTIGTNAFYNNSKLRSVILPNGVTDIEDYAFNNCFNLLTVNMPNNLTSIGSKAFYDCWGLTWVTIPNTVTNIGNDAFFFCNSFLSFTVAAGNPNYASLGGVLFDSTFTTLIQFPGALTGSYIIPNSVTNIGSHAFYSGGYGPTSVTIPSGVTTIGSSAFSFCQSLTNISVAADNPNYASAGGVLFDKSLTTLIQFPAGLHQSSYIIPSSVTNITSLAFSYSSGLAGVTIPNSVVGIGNYAFVYCRYLTNITVATDNPNYASVGGVLFDKILSTLIQYPAGLHQSSYTIPSSVTDIGGYAFAWCSGLTNVAIPNSVSIIESSAFNSCYGLTNVTIPNSLTDIGLYAFSSCSSLRQAYFQGNAPNVNGRAGSADTTIFAGESGTVYYLPGTTGWNGTFGGWPAVLWNPLMQSPDGRFGVDSNLFSFIVTGTANIPVVVEGGTGWAGAWTPLFTGTLTNGSISFSDPQWTNYPGRYYRVRSP